MSGGMCRVNSSQKTSNSSGTVLQCSNVLRGMKSFKVRSDDGANKLKRNRELKIHCASKITSGGSRYTL